MVPRSRPLRPRRSRSRRPWHTRWIWAGSSALVPVSVQTTRLDADASRRVVLLRTTVVLDGAVPDHVPARVTADSRYVLWVNGTEVARGPVRSNPSLLRYDEVDLAPHLRPGRNTIAAVARFYGQATPWWHPAPPTWGLGAGAFLFEADLGDRSIVSDASWKALVTEGDEAHDGSILSALPVELADGRRLPVGWTSPDFDDGPWLSAEPLAVHHIGFGGSHHPPSHPYGPLLPRPIAFLTDRQRAPAYLSLWTGAGAALVDDPVRAGRGRRPRVAPARLDLPGDAEPLDIEPPTDGVTVVHVDFGEIVAGTVELEVDAPAGPRFDVMCAEGAERRRHVAARRAAQRLPLRSRRGTDDRFETFDPVGLPLRRGLGARPRRWCASPSSPCTSGTYPRPEGPYFACSDPLLDDDLARRAAHRRPLLARRLPRLPDARAARLDRRLRRAPDGRPRDQRRLAPRALARRARRASPRPDGMLPMAVAGDIEHADCTVIPDWALHWVHALCNL